jgi:plastocyanin
MKKRTITLVLAVTAAAVLALPVLAAAPKLTGTVGPGFTISMAKKPTKAGKYTLVVSDKSSFHNFHLIGPGVNVKTSVATKGTKAFAIKLAKGKYRFFCDPHATTMKGSFTIK